MEGNTHEGEVPLSTPCCQTGTWPRDTPRLQILLPPLTLNTIITSTSHSLTSQDQLHKCNCRAALLEAPRQLIGSCSRLQSGIKFHATSPSPVALGSIIAVETSSGQVTLKQQCLTTWQVTKNCTEHFSFGLWSFQTALSICHCPLLVRTNTCEERPSGCRVLSLAAELPVSCTSFVSLTLLVQPMISSNKLPMESDPVDPRTLSSRLQTSQ